MSRMTKERRADLEKLADEDPHMCLLRELLNEIDALQRESAQLLKEQVRLLQETANQALACIEDGPRWIDPKETIERLRAAIEEVKEGV